MIARNATRNGRLHPLSCSYFLRTMLTSSSLQAWRFSLARFAPHEGRCHGFINSMWVQIPNKPGQYGQAQQAIEHTHGERASHDEEDRKPAAIVHQDWQGVPK